MDTTRTSLILAIVAIAIAAVSAYLWYGQAQTVDALTEQVAALEREVGISVQPATGIDARIDSIEDQLDQTGLDLASARIALASKATVNGDQSRVNARAIAILEQELNQPPDLGNPWGEDSVEQLRADLDGLTDCVNLNMDAVYQWSRYPTAGAFYGYICSTG